MNPLEFNAIEVYHKLTINQFLADIKQIVRKKQFESFVLLLSAMATSLTHGASMIEPFPMTTNRMRMEAAI
jgi:hypothetical protein